jgi:hypothetical protein
MRFESPVLVFFSQKAKENEQQKAFQTTTGLFLEERRVYLVPEYYGVLGEEGVQGSVCG